MAKQKKRRPRSEVEKFVDLLAQEMPVDAEWMVGGSWRRESLTVGDLDVMLVTHNGRFNDFSFPKSFLPVRHGTQIVNGILAVDDDAIGVDFWTCAPTCVGAFVMFITGPAALNIAQRAHAQSVGLTLSQYGLLDREGKLIPLVSERAVYDRLGLTWLEPRERERWAEKRPDSSAEWVSWQVPSHSSSARYTVRRRGDYWDCTCLGFAYSRVAPRTCKHVEQKKRELGLS